jgi:hypothetical protein
MRIFVFLDEFVIFRRWWDDLSFIAMTFLLMVLVIVIILVLVNFNIKQSELVVIVLLEDISNDFRRDRLVDDFLHSNLVAAADGLIVDESRHSHYGEPVVLGRQCSFCNSLRRLTRTCGWWGIRLKGATFSSLAELLQELSMHL